MTRAAPWLVPIALGASLARAQDSAIPSPERDEMQAHYTSVVQNQQIILQGAPLYLISPIAESFTFLGGFDTFAAAVVPKGKQAPSAISADTEHYLEMTGWSFAPLMTIATKSLAFGLTVEDGKRQMHYLRQASPTATFEEHYGELQYNGVGGYFYLIPKLSFLSPNVAPTAVIGGKSLAVQHKSADPRYQALEEPVLNSYRYNVQDVNLGLSVGIRFLSILKIILWYDYTMTTVGKGSGAKSEAEQTATTASGKQVLAPGLATFKSDQKLAWSTHPEQNYGIDFAILVLGRLDINVGGAFGFLGASDDRVLSSSLALSASYAPNATTRR